MPYFGHCFKIIRFTFFVHRFYTMVFKYSLPLSSLDTPLPRAHLSVSLEITNCQIQRNFGWRYAIGRALRMPPPPQLHVCIMKFIQPEAMIFSLCSGCFQKKRKQIIFLSSPLLGIIYIGLNPKFVDVIIVWSS